MANTIPQMFLETVRNQPTVSVQYSKNASGTFIPASYEDLLERISIFAAGLLEMGIRRGDKIGLISDNRSEWLVVDLAILGLGGADVPRGCDAMPQEIRYILNWSGCSLAILENDRQLRKIVDNRAGIPSLATIIMFDPASAGTLSEARAVGLEILDYQAVVEKGRIRKASKPSEYIDEVAKGQRSELATLIYTSGTTGEPKGVMLSHGNFLHQTDYLPGIIGVGTGEIFLSVLPVWHSFERVVQYIILKAGAGIAYSKPIGSIMLADMATIRPQWFTSVPRIWESIKDGVYRSMKQGSAVKQTIFRFFIGVGESYAYFRNHLTRCMPEFVPRSRLLEIASSIIPFVLLTPLWHLGDILVYRKIKAKLGGKFIAGVSGGGALPGNVDRFFGAIGVLIIEGYGLTETAPVLGVRLKSHPVVSTVGPIHRGTELKIVDEKGKLLGPGQKGVIHVRGPQVMTGYYRKPDLTAKVLSPDGWLDTGDLGMLTYRGEIKITGRAKDTIVLRGGENIEPVPIEQKLCESVYLQQAVVLGQDEKYLAALIVPSQENVLAWAKDNTIPIDDYESLLQQPEVKELIDAEINEYVSARQGFKSFERIFKFALLAAPFEVGKELSAKQEIKRHAVNEIYKKQIHKLFKAEKEIRA
jgi:long-chain acyl-CoA synthetase